MIERYTEKRKYGNSNHPEIGKPEWSETETNSVDNNNNNNNNNNYYWRYFMMIIIYI